MAGRLRLRDILLVLPVRRVEAVRRGAEISARQRRADYRRPGSLTYNRQRARECYEQAYGPTDWP